MTKTKNKKILIIDDEASLQRVLKSKLLADHFQATTMSNGILALELLEKESFDLILLDLVMPQLDGFGVLAELRKRKNKTPVIVLSNLDQEGLVEGSKEALGVKDYFIKANASLEEIVERINQILDEK